MIPCKRVTHGFLCKPRYVAEVPAHLRPAAMARAPTGDPVVCLFLAHKERDGGAFWIVDCARSEEPRVYSAPVGVRPQSFVFYTRDDCVYIVLQRERELFQMRFSYKTQTADPLRAMRPISGALIGCTEDGNLVLSDELARGYHNHAEGCAYELVDDTLEAHPLPARASALVSELSAESARDVGAARRELYFASASEAVVGPGSIATHETYVVVPWTCRVHPHTLQYARAYGHEVRTGAVRAAGWRETRMALDGPPLAWEWLDGDGLCAATETRVHVLFSDAERLGWWDFLAETVLFRVPFLLLLAWIMLENQVY